MKNNDFILSMNHAGELLIRTLHYFTLSKYRTDNPFLKEHFAFFWMVVCCSIDIAFFRSLFAQISYDDPIMIVLEVMGLAFAADVVPIYAGILAKRIRQGLSHDKMNLILLLTIPILALIVNAVLRICTISVMSVDGTINSESIALTIIQIVTPVFTSIGCFAISFMTYDPLAKKMRSLEMALEETLDNRRRLRSIRTECESASSSRLIEMDHKLLVNAKKQIINNALLLCTDVCVKLMESSGDPAATNVLSKSLCDAFLKRFKTEWMALGATAILGEDTVETADKNVLTFRDAA